MIYNELGYTDYAISYWILSIKCFHTYGMHFTLFSTPANAKWLMTHRKLWTQGVNKFWRGVVNIRNFKKRVEKSKVQFCISLTIWIKFIHEESPILWKENDSGLQIINSNCIIQYHKTKIIEHLSMFECTYLAKSSKHKYSTLKIQRKRIK